jgi:HEPN domain-containing protein
MGLEYMAKQTSTPNEWRLLAERDMSVAEHLSVTMTPTPTEVVAFFCQQTIEKFLKGTLVILGEEPPYTHDLPELCKLAEKYRPSFAGISSFCSIITHFSVQPRYDFGLNISDEDMRLVLAHTKTIIEFLKKEMPELFQGQV